MIYFSLTAFVLILIQVKLTAIVLTYKVLCISVIYHVIATMSMMIFFCEIVNHRSGFFFNFNCVKGVHRNVLLNSLQSIHRPISALEASQKLGYLLNASLYFIWTGYDMHCASLHFIRGEVIMLHKKEVFSQFSVHSQRGSVFDDSCVGSYQ